MTGARVKCTTTASVWSSSDDDAGRSADGVSPRRRGFAGGRLHTRCWEAFERALGRRAVSVVLTGDAKPAAPSVKKESLPVVPAETSAEAGPQVVVTTSADTLVVIRPQFVPTTKTESTLAGLPMVVEPTKPETTQTTARGFVSLETRRHLSAAGKNLGTPRSWTFWVTPCSSGQC